MKRTISVLFALVLAGCGANQTGGGGGGGWRADVTAGAPLVVGESPLNGGIYTGENQCVSVSSNAGNVQRDSLSLTTTVTIGNGGFPEVDGQAVHPGQRITEGGSPVVGENVVTLLTTTTDGVVVMFDSELTVTMGPPENLSGERRDVYRELADGRLEVVSTSYLFAFSENGSMSIVVDCKSVLSR